MSNLPSTNFELLSAQLHSLPLWIKQVLYSDLRTELEQALSKKTLDAFTPEHTLQAWKPEVTRQGLSELEKPSGHHPQSVLRLLYMARLGKDVLSITLLNNWTLEQSAKVLSHSIRTELLVPPRSMVITGTIDYLSGTTRLGEYLVQINRLNMMQLDQALHTQQTIEEAMGERTGIADVLINLGYIKKEDSEGILFLKEESKKAFNWKLALAEADNTPPRKINTP